MLHFCKKRIRKIYHQPCVLRKNKKCTRCYSFFSYFSRLTHIIQVYLYERKIFWNNRFYWFLKSNNQDYFWSSINFVDDQSSDWFLFISFYLCKKLPSYIPPFDNIGNSIRQLDCTHYNTESFTCGCLIRNNFHCSWKENIYNNTH